MNFDAKDVESFPKIMLSHVDLLTRVKVIDSWREIVSLSEGACRDLWSQCW